MDKQNRCIIVIPVYKEFSHDEEFSFHRTLEVFADWTIALAAPVKLKQYLENVCVAHSQITMNFFDKGYFTSVKQYNRLMTSLEFYSCYEAYQYLCICQLDVLALEDQLEEWMKQGWDYIGAPLFEGYGKTDSKVFKETLNGGFSLRKVQSFITVLRAVKFRYAPIELLWSMENDTLYKMIRFIRDGLIFNYNLNGLRTLINEDLYWAYIVPRLHQWFKIPGPEVAQYFAFDAHPRWLYERNGNKLPMAIHAWRRFDPEFVESIMQGELAPCTLPTPKPAFKLNDNPSYL